MGWAAGVERILLAGEVPAAAPAQARVELFVRSTARSPRARAPGVRPAHPGALGGAAAQMELAGRSLKGQLSQADSLGARYVAIVGGLPDGAQGHAARRPGAGAADTVVHAVLRGQHAL